MAQEEITCVDWLVKKIVDNHDKSFMEFYKAEIQYANRIFEKQIKCAYNDGADDMVSNKYKGMNNYYNENYKECTKD